MAFKPVNKSEAFRVLQVLNSGVKTPVSLVMELATQLGREVEFDEARELIWEKNSFKFNARLGDIEAVGYGKSKKEAKQNSAQELLNIIQNSARNNDDSLTEAPVFTTPSPSSSRTESPSSIGNAVGVLQNLAAKNRWKLPEYEYPEAIGQPHCKTFSCLVKMMSGLECKGTGSNKKSAKKRAAEKMLNRLQGDDVDAVDMGMRDHLSVSLSYNQESNSDSSILDGSDLEEYNSSSSDSPHPDMDISSDADDSFDNQSMAILESRSSREGFRIEYISLPSKSKKGLYQVFVKLEFIKSGGIDRPPVVTHGSGETENIACHKGAARALKHLEIMMSLP